MEPKPVLDHGMVRLVEFMGSDQRIVDAARVSYKSVAKKRSDEGLIHYLMRNKHTSPFEHVVFEWHIKCPIFVARQWMRHRTGSFNEISARYSVLPDEFYIPSEVRVQDTKNRQATIQAAPMSTQSWFIDSLDGLCTMAYALYSRSLEMGIAREQARMMLPVNVYTEFYWKIDLHNLLHFIQLRTHPHAQHEIRVYALTMATIVKDIVPIAYAAFEEYRMKDAETI